MNFKIAIGMSDSLHSAEEEKRQYEWLVRLSNDSLSQQEFESLWDDYTGDLV